MAEITGRWQTWKPEIDAYIKDEDDTMPTAVYSTLFSERTTNRLQYNEVTRAGLNPMDEVGEMGNAVDDEQTEGYKYSYNRKIYRKQETFSKLLWDTDQTDTVERMARDLPRACRYSRELNIWGMVRNAYDTSLTFGDGLQLISLSHPRKDGGTVQPNTFTDGVQLPLSYDNALTLQDVQIAVVSNVGNLMSVSSPGKNKVLLVGPYLREVAFQIAGVEGPDGEPDTAENNENYFRRGDKFDVLVVDWLSYEAAYQAGETAVAKTSASNWWDSMWGIVDKELAKRYFKVFSAPGYPDYDDEINKRNESLIKFGYDHYTWGNTAWYPIALSKGDNSTFSS